MHLQSYKESIKFFKKISYKSNEYYLRGKFVGVPVEKLPTRFAHTFLNEDLVIKQIHLENQQARNVLKEDAIVRFHPNNIDNKDFWVRCRQQFPLVSVCGNESKSIEEVNYQTLGLAKNIRFIEFLNETFEKSSQKLNLLEIGFGYGSLFFEVKDKCNYFGIDYIIPPSLRKHKNFIAIDKSGIPDYLIGYKFFDIVYSVNVLQHCSQQDRFNYFKEGYQALKTGGYFLFTENLMTEKNKDSRCWGFVDEKGRGYTNFFNQLTECDWDYELFNCVNEIGFKPVFYGIVDNFFVGIIKKN